MNELHGVIDLLPLSVAKCFDVLPKQPHQGQGSNVTAALWPNHECPRALLQLAVLNVSETLECRTCALRATSFYLWKLLFLGTKNFGTSKIFFPSG